MNVSLWLIQAHKLIIVSPGKFIWSIENHKPLEQVHPSSLARHSTRHRQAHLSPWWLQASIKQGLLYPPHCSVVRPRPLRHWSLWRLTLLQRSRWHHTSHSGRNSSLKRARLLWCKPCWWLKLGHFNHPSKAQANAATLGVLVTSTWCAQLGIKFGPMIIEELWLVSVLASRLTCLGIVVPEALKVLRLVNPQHTLGFSRRLVLRLTLMLMMILLAFLLARVATSWSHSALTTVD